MGVRLLTGDCRSILQTFDAESIDAVITDPPYGIGFMSASWDTFAPATVAKATAGRERKGTVRSSERWPDRLGTGQGGGANVRYDETRSGNQRFQAWCEEWLVECLRVLKPGGHLVAFGGTRTFHRLMCAVEDVGFEVRDCLMWVFGNGFPKSLDVGKAFDKAAGAERVVSGAKVFGDGRTRMTERESRASGWDRQGRSQPEAVVRNRSETEPVTDLARQWDGWGTALKPGWEPIILARKPLVGTVIGNVAAYGTGALHIAACRIGDDGGHEFVGKRKGGNTQAVAVYGDGLNGKATCPVPGLGRWPANVLLTHDPACVEVGVRRIRSDGHFPAARGVGGIGTRGHSGQEGLAEGSTRGEVVAVWECVDGCPVAMVDEQSGVSVSRQRVGHRAGKGAKPFGAFAGQSSAVMGHDDAGGASRFFYTSKASASERNKGMPHGLVNDHPTVKPLAICEWITRLACPPGGTVLDPFLGSGSIGCAAARQGFDFVGIDREEHYVEIATARIRYWATAGPRRTGSTRRGGTPRRPACDTTDITQLGLPIDSRCPDPAIA